MLDRRGDDQGGIGDDIALDRLGQPVRGNGLGCCALGSVAVAIGDEHRAPLRAKSSEIALPMPDPPPVTTATLPTRAAPATPTEAAYNERPFVKVPSRGSACERSLLSVSGSDVVIYGVAPRVAAALLVVSIVIILPITLLGALFVEIGPEFGLERCQLGLLVAVVLGVSILVAPVAGILSERRGASRALALSAVLAAAACAGIAWVARSGVGLVRGSSPPDWPTRSVSPATTIFVAQTIPLSRQGFAFGVKQATAPLGTLLAGIAVPAFALTVGWRWAFATTAALAVAAAFAVPRLARSRRQASPALGRLGLPRRNTILLLILAIMLGVGAASPSECSSSTRRSQRASHRQWQDGCKHSAAPSASPLAWSPADSPTPAQPVTFASSP